MKKSRMLTREDVLHLAKLSNLPLSDKEVEKCQEQLGETLEYVENLKEVNTSKVHPLQHDTKLENVSFNDGVENKRGLSKEEALLNTKNKKKNMFVVKRLIE